MARNSLTQQALTDAMAARARYEDPGYDGPLPPNRYGDPYKTRQMFLDAMQANPANPFIDPTRASMSAAMHADNWRAPRSIGTSAAGVGRGAYVPTADDYSDWGRAVSDPILAEMLSIPMSEGGLAEPEGTGLFGDPFIGTLFSAGLGFAGPAAAALGAISQARNNPLGSLLALAAPTIGPGLWNKGKNFLRRGGFVNSGALGLTGANLALPGLVNAPAAAPVAGYGASALGLTGANLALPGLLNATGGIPIAGYGASAVGGDPSLLYRPGIAAQSGRPMGTPSLPGGAPSGGNDATSGHGVTLSGGAAPQFTAPAGGQTFDAVLTAAGKMPNNALAMSGMGAGRLAASGRDLYRNPGYQPGPVANFLLRA